MRRERQTVNKLSSGARLEATAEARRVVEFRGHPQGPSSSLTRWDFSGRDEGEPHRHPGREAAGTRDAHTGGGGWGGGCHDVALEAGALGAASSSRGK